MKVPFVNIKITKEKEPVTTEQKQRLILGVTGLVAEILGRNKASTVVIIDEIDMDNYGLGGESIAQVRQKQGR